MSNILIQTCFGVWSHFWIIFNREHLHSLHPVRADRPTGRDGLRFRAGVRQVQVCLE